MRLQSLSGVERETGSADQVFVLSEQSDNEVQDMLGFDESQRSATDVEDLAQSTSLEAPMLG